MATRRSYGTGSLWERTDQGGSVTFYGEWRADGRKVRRRVGPKRAEGGRDGLTRAQAERELRRLMAEIVPTPHAAGDALTIAELGRRYVARMRHDGRKHSSIVAVESVLATWLVPYFAERDLRRVRVEDVRDLARMMERARDRARGERGDRRYGRPLATKTVRDRIGTLSAMLALAERQGWVAGNVAKRVVDLPRGAPQVSES
jgi:hypothetical protein